VGLIVTLIAIVFVARSSSLSILLSHEGYIRISLSDEQQYEDEDGTATAVYSVDYPTLQR